jgi:phospholipid/cholesterol/gamma-HCH transport system substrate-binding protein
MASAAALRVDWREAMDREGNYVAVGAFVLLALVLGAGFVLWYTNRADGQQERRYEIYFDGSVSGLSEGGSVRYLGVSVGRVSRIGIDPRNPARVRVVADISEDTPIKGDTVARLALQGVTGLLYMNLEPRDPASLPPPRVESLKYPVIPSQQSQFNELVGSLPEVVAKAGEALNRVNAMLSDKNLVAVTATLANAEKTAGELPLMVGEARAMFLELRAAATEIKVTAEALHELSGTGGEQIKVAATRLREVADNVSAMTARLDRMVERNEGNIDHFAGEGLAEFQELVRETRQAVRSIDLLSESLERDPSRLIYKPAPAGVEIPQ